MVGKKGAWQKNAGIRVMEVPWKPDQSAATQPAEPYHCKLIEPEMAAAGMRVIQVARQLRGCVGMPL